MAGLKVWCVLVVTLCSFCQRCIPSGISTHVEIGKARSERIFMCFHELLGKKSKLSFVRKATGGNNVKVMSVLHTFLYIFVYI